MAEDNEVATKEMQVVIDLVAFYCEGEKEEKILEKKKRQQL